MDYIDDDVTFTPPTLEEEIIALESKHIALDKPITTSTWSLTHWADTKTTTLRQYLIEMTATDPKKTKQIVTAIQNEKTPAEIEKAFGQHRGAFRQILQQLTNPALDNTAGTALFKKAQST